KEQVFLLALVFVALKFLIGILFHTLKDSRARFGLVCLGLLLASTEAYFAYERTMVVEEIEHLANGLTEAPQAFSQTALSAAFTAFLSAIFEPICVYAVFRLAGRALPWVVVSPVLLIVGILFSAAWLATKCQLATRLGVCLQAVISALAGIGSVMLNALTSAVPAIFRALASALRACWEFFKHLPLRAYEGWHTWRMNLIDRRLARQQLDLERRERLAERKAELADEAHIKGVRRKRELLKEQAELDEFQIAIIH